MRKFLSLALMCGLACPTVALAQGEETPAEAEPAAEPAEEGMPEAPKQAADDIEAEYAPEEPEEGARPFLDGLSWQLMASAFYNFNGYRVAGPYNDLTPASGERDLYPYTNYMGFGLNFAGGDVMYTGEKFGVRLDLRFGTAADLLTPLAPIKQAYASYMPHERISLDLGFFDTIYGAEVVDEWNNANYTRGALYFLRQPFNHLGLRAGFELTDIMGFTLIVTNGTVFGGTPVDDNEVPSVGWQFGFTPDGHRSVRRRGLLEGYREVGVFFGANHGANGLNGNKDWNHFFDWVVNLNFDWFTLILNGDYFVDPNDTRAPLPPGETKQTLFTYGHSLAMVFDITDNWAIGARGEHLSGNDRFRNPNIGGITGLTYGYLWTGTLTIRYKPVQYLVLSLEGRIEGARSEIYFSRSSVDNNGDGAIDPNKNIYGAVILGATAYIGN